MVLTCGHNGSFGSDEVTLYEMHLKEAGFIIEKETENEEDVE